MYTHERQERRESQYPMNTSLPSVSSESTDFALMEEYLTKRDLDCATAIENGWFPSRYAGDCLLRIVIPAVTHKKDHVYWQARAITPKPFIRYQSPKGPRYDALIQVSPAFHTPKNINVVVEGPMDALAVAELGYTAFALMGTYPPNSTVDYLASMLGRNPTFLILDRDAGQYAPRIVTRIASHGKNVKMIQWEAGKDIAGVKKAERVRFLNWLERLL